MESHNISTSTILLENIDENIPVSVNLTTATKDIEIGSKSSATTPCKNPLETELIPLTLFVLEQFYLIKNRFRILKIPTIKLQIHHTPLR